MWFEILPPFLIIATAVSFPQYFAAGVHWLFFGNVYHRSLLHDGNRRSYLRDWSRFGCPYRIVGLEGIPDEEEASSEEPSKDDVSSSEPKK